MLKQHHNPILPETILTLADGVARRFCPDYHCLSVLELATGSSFQRVLLSGLGARNTAAWIYAGCHQDALDRRDKGWTLEFVNKMLQQAGPLGLMELIRVIDPLIGAAFQGPEGESQPAAASAPAAGESAPPNGPGAMPALQPIAQA